MDERLPGPKKSVFLHPNCGKNVVGIASYVLARSPRKVAVPQERLDVIFLNSVHDRERVAFSVFFVTLVWMSLVVALRVAKQIQT